jgi:hypothetical protein
VYVAYELLGFTGLGPGRDALREQGAHALLPYAPWLAAYALATAAVLGAGLWNLRCSPWRLRVAGVGVALLLPTAFLLATGVLRHFRVLGRHFTPLLVVILLVLAWGVAWWWGRGRLGRSVAVGWLILALCSALSVRWASRHQKDDYRTAAAHTSVALELGWRVWWNAAPQGARYYGVPITTNSADTDRAFALFGPAVSELERAAVPDLILVSRPDVYDHHRALVTWLSEKRYRQTTGFAGFEVWERP